MGDERGEERKVEKVNLGKKEEMKGGHPPAQKVGGMRVVSHRRDSESAKETPSKDGDKKAAAAGDDEFGVDKPVKAPSVSRIISISVASTFFASRVKTGFFSSVFRATVDSRLSDFLSSERFLV